MYTAYDAIYLCVFFLKTSTTRLVLYQQLNSDQQLRKAALLFISYLFSSDSWLHFSELQTHMPCLFERINTFSKCTRILGK